MGSSVVAAIYDRDLYRFKSTHCDAAWRNFVGRNSHTQPDYRSGLCSDRDFAQFRDAEIETSQIKLIFNKLGL